MGRKPYEVFPVFGEADGDVIVMFRGDAGYESADGSLPGARHRAVLRDEHWRYVREDVSVEFPSFIN